MVNELNTRVLRADAPFPSVETLLHAIIPHQYVDHTHADAVLAVSNAPDGEKRVREIYGKRVVVGPYVMAGFDLASYCAREFPKQAGKETIGMVLLSHGIFSFGAGARSGGGYTPTSLAIRMARNRVPTMPSRIAATWPGRVTGTMSPKPMVVSVEKLKYSRSVSSRRAGVPRTMKVVAGGSSIKA